MMEIGMFLEDRESLVCVLVAECAQRFVLGHYVTMRKIKSCCYKEESYDVRNPDSLRPLEIRGDRAEKNIGRRPDKCDDHSVQRVVESLLLSRFRFQWKE